MTARERRPRRQLITNEALDQAIEQHGVRPTPPMLRALRLVLVQGKTWRTAAIACDVTESGIHRAMVRYHL